MTVAHPSSPVRIINAIVGEAVAADAKRIAFGLRKPACLQARSNAAIAPALVGYPLFALRLHTVDAVAPAKSAVPGRLRIF